jgi:tetratricopeptide (TPR) repeat protein
MTTSAPTMPASLIKRLLLVLIPLAVLAAFWPTLSGDFITWDDDANFLNNPHVRELSWRNLRWMLTTFHMSNYQPLSWLIASLEHALWGMRPAGYHATSLVFHILNAVLFYLVATRLLRLAAPAADDAALPLAAVSAALFFALHPLRVESVAWLSGQHDLQAGAFYLLAILCYLRAGADPARRRRWLAGCAALFAASLLCKANGITLPVVLLLLDFYPLRRLPADPRKWREPEHRRIWLEKLPLFALAAVAGGVSLVARHQGGVLQQYSLGFRVQQAIYGLALYLGNTVFPVGLMPFHPVPQDLRLPPAVVGGSAGLVLAVTAVLLCQRRRWPGALLAWACYVVTLLPVLGLVSVGTQLTADRYTYLPSMAWAVLVGAAVLAGLRRSGTRLVLGAGLGAILLTFAGLSWRQSSLWHDSETLFRHVLAQRQDIPEVHNNLGFVLVNQRRTEEGMAEYRKALAIDPNFTKAMNNLGLALLGQGRYPEAIAQYRKALDLEPDYAFGHNNLGLALMYLDRPADALPHFQKALDLVPEYVLAHVNLGGALLMLGRVDEAIAHYRKALDLRPDHAAAATMLRIAEAQRQR